MAQGYRDGIHDGLAQAAQNEQQDDDALKEDDAHGDVPVAAAHGGGNAGDHGVDAQARGAGERTVGKDAHADGHDAGAQTGGAGERAAVDAGAGEYRRVDGDDVGHRKERGQARADLGAEGRASLTVLKERFHESPFRCCGSLPQIYNVLHSTVWCLDKSTACGQYFQLVALLSQDKAR